MEQEGQSLTPILTAALIFGLVLGALNTYRVYLPFIQENMETIDTYMTAASLACFAINPVLVFIGFYLVGRRFDSKAKLVPSIVSLIVGAYVGSMIGVAVTTLIARPEYFSSWEYTLAFEGFAFNSFIRLFFVAFTALATAHIKKTRRVEAQQSSAADA